MSHSIERALLSSARATLAVIAAFGVLGLATGQTLPRSYVASPDVYKVVAENKHFRIIEVTWKPGQRDQLHSHPASGVYYLTDCALRLYGPEGSFRDVTPPAGLAMVQDPIPGHVLQNIGSSDCRLIMFEPV